MMKNLDCTIILLTIVLTSLKVSSVPTGIGTKLGIGSYEYVAVVQDRNKREADYIIDRPQNDNDDSGMLSPQIYSFYVTSDIRYRYARTLVTSRVVNKNSNRSSEVVFQMVLPEAAFISKFVIEIDGKKYEAYVKEKEEAQKVYNDARQQGLSAGLVEVNARHANVFNVNLNVKALSKVTFNLTYEEFLLRKLGVYEHAVNIRPEQFSQIKDFKITVNILESQNITTLKVPKLRDDTEIETEAAEKLNEVAVISRPMGNSAVITWTPTAMDQQKWKTNGVLGKFIIQYDIARESEAGEILLMNGYFVHFFAPSNILPVRKHVVYVLDTSGSMHGTKLEQMKSVIKTVMDDLKPDDYFNFIEFSSQSRVWIPNYSTGESSVANVQPIIASEFALRQAHQYIESLQPTGATNIDAALKDALAITSRLKPTPQKEGIGTLPDNVESLIMFLTDGEPTTGETKLDAILSNSKTRNIAQVPIYTIAFGKGADFDFLKKIALQNNGFGRKIYEGGDAAIQIGKFYKEISSPLLSNITFKYTTNSTGYSVSKLTTQHFPNIFTGSEIAVAGCISRPTPKLRDYIKKTTNLTDVAQSQIPSVPFLAVDIDANGRDGQVTLKTDNLDGLRYDIDDWLYNLTLPTMVVPTVVVPTTVIPTAAVPTPAPTVANPNVAEVEDEFLERLWVYITIKQLLNVNPGHNETTDYVYEDFGDNLLIEDVMEEDELPIIPSTSLKSNESSKDRALRLALKYGFVTPITSLVVVKPNDTERLGGSGGAEEAVNLEAAKQSDIKGLRPYSISSPNLRRHKTNRVSHHQPVDQRGNIHPFSMRQSFPQVPRTIQKLSVPDQSLRWSLPGDHRVHEDDSMGAKKLMEVAKLRFQGQHASMEMTRIRPDNGVFLNKGSFWESAARSMWSSQTTPPTRSTTTKRQLATLALIKWPIQKDAYGKLSITVAGTNYAVANHGDTLAMFDPEDKSCSGGVRHKRFHGKCQHIMNCIKSEFTENFNTYVDNYFCIIDGITKYAGVCCSK